jgi:hypothetical protein
MDAAATDPNIIAKLRGIQAKIISNEDYAKSMTMPALVKFVKARATLNVDLEGPEGDEELVFYPDPARRWRILKLLDDDFLHSELTALDYESNSKTFASSG